jgi:AraC-like DNA-binding protein
MHSRFDQPLSVHKIAAASYVSASHLSSLFQRQMKMTPMQYLERVRMERAKALLRFTSLSVTEIAIAVGYRDSNYFARRFRACCGQTPREFRNASKRSLEKP